MTSHRHLRDAPVGPEDPTRHLLALPAEIRLAILEHVFPPTTRSTDPPIFTRPDVDGPLLLDESYSSTRELQCLQTNHRLHSDAASLAFARTTFLASSVFTPIPDRLRALPDDRLAAIRRVAFVADARHFRRLPEWGRHAFGVPRLRLATLTVVLHRSSFWHYLFDYTAVVVEVLRGLEGVDRVEFVRNGALVKGGLRTWYNRLVGLMMKVDHAERFDRMPANPEKVWWRWGFDEEGQRIWLEALPPKECMGEVAYMQMMVPLMEELRVSVESEEWNPDPRSRNHYY